MNYFSYDIVDYDFLASIGIIALVIGFFVVLIIALLVVAKWRLFKKAGRRGWKSLIPFYSSWILVEIAGLKWWWFLFLIIEFTFKFDMGDFFLSFSIAKFFGTFNCYYNIAKRFGKDYSTCIVAGLFPTIFACIFAFSKNEIYDESIPVSDNGIFGGDISVNKDDKNNRYTNNYRDKYVNQENNESTVIVDRDDIDNIDDNNNDGVSNDNSDDNKNDVNKGYSYCSNCGLKLRNDIKYCPKCGKRRYR